jgi:hypothetical protein
MIGQLMGYCLSTAIDGKVQEEMTAWKQYRHRNNCKNICKNVFFRVVDPDPDWIRIQRLCGSGSVFGIRIRIQGQEN